MKDSASESIEFHLKVLDIPRLDVVEPGVGATRSAGAGKSLALITYLALAPRNSSTRDALCDLLWGDRPLNQSRPLLRQTLWLIKTQIHETIIQADSETVSLSCAVSSDVDAFVSAIAENDLELAVQLYKSDFFGGYGAPGAGRFEEWANSERVRLRGLFLSSAETLARRAINSGHFQDAIVLARRMRDIDPHGQVGWRLQLEARVASGDTIGARADADQVDEWLRAEEWEPDPETSAAIRIARRSPATGPDSAQRDEFTTELVGREQEFSLIHDAWLATKSSGSRFVHVVGDSGLGKTRLMQDMVARIRASRGKVRYVRANLSEQTIPFSFASAIAEAVASFSGAAGIAPSAARTLVSLNPKLSSQYSNIAGSERLEPLRVGLAILELISATSDENAIAIVLDDLHWCDSYSREALTVVASRLSEEKAFVLSSARTHYSAGRLRHESPELVLKRLSCSEVTILLTSLARLPDNALAEKLAKAFCAASDGVPFRLLEAIRFCVDAGLLSRKGEEWVCPDSGALFSALDGSATTARRLSNLTRNEKEIVGLMSLAGMPIPRKLVSSASSQSDQQVSATVASLERRGLVIVDDTHWSLSHDSIGEVFLANEEAEYVTALHSRLGIALSASNQEEWRKRSIPHLARAGQLKYAARMSAPFLDSSASTGTDARQSIAALLGWSDEETVSGIFAALPFRKRHPRIIRHATAATLLLAAAGASLLALNRASPTPSTMLVMIRRTPDGNTELREAPLDMAHWDATSPLTFRRTLEWKGSSNDRLDHLTPRPGTNSWAVYSVYPDSGEGDIDLIDITGKRNRLTRSPHDDRPMSFSPDGEQLLFVTSRWSPKGWSDVGIIDMRTGVTTRLTFGTAKYERPRWSPDGTRISYNEDDHFCIADSDGSHAHCENVPGWRVSWAIGWLDSHHVFISGENAGLPDSRGVFDIDRRVAKLGDIPPRTEIVTEPSGNWLISTRSADGDVNYGIAPAARYDLAKFITPDPIEGTVLTFLKPTDDGSYVDTVRVLRPPQPIPPNVPIQLAAQGLTKRRQIIPPAVTRWRSLTPDVATVDSLGVMTASREGIAIVELSAGGWRKVVDTVTVRSAGNPVLLEEKWNVGVNARWRVFGVPSPVLVHARDKTAFLNNGDGSFFSGAYAKQVFSARNGIAMDLELSTPISALQWQLIMPGLQPVSPDTHLDKWDHKTGYMSHLLGDQTGCWFDYPAGEGKGATTRVPWYKSMLLAMQNSSFRIDDGSWYRIRIQILPDGRCGVAINNRAIYIMPGSGPIKYPVMPILQGMSVGTKILVGPVKISAGVPNDVDWTGLVYNGYAWYREISEPVIAEPTIDSPKARK